MRLFFKEIAFTNEEVRSSGMLSLDKDTKLLTNMNKYKVPLRTLKNVFLCAIPVEHRKIPFSPLFAFASLCSSKVICAANV